MKYRKSLCSMFLLALVLGTTSPALVSANETTVAPEMTTTTTSEATTSLPVETTELTETTKTLDALTTTTEVSTTEETTTEESEPSTEDGDTAALVEAGILEAIIGKDDQYRVQNTTVFPYRTIVHLEMKFGSQSYLGSGVMIAPNLVLTCAHNVFDQATGSWATSVKATPGKNGSSAPYGTYTSTKYYTFRNYTTEGNVSPSNYDIAVVRLDRNVSSSVGYLSVSTSISRGQRVQIPGFPAYTSSKRFKMYTAFGNVDDLNSALIGHLVDAESGNSGSAILNSKNQVVGIHTTGYYTNKPFGTYNVGTRITNQVVSLINHAKSNGDGTLTFTSNKETKTGKVYRLYNAGAQRHLYTQNLNEALVLTTRGWQFEGLKFRTASKGTPVYRLYGKIMKEHIYTTSKNERDVLARTRDWNAEGIAWYSAGKQPVYRLYNPGIRVHLYTLDKNEVKVLGTRGWKNEGVAFYTQ